MHRSSIGALNRPCRDVGIVCCLWFLLFMHFSSVFRLCLCCVCCVREGEKRSSNLFVVRGVVHFVSLKTNCYYNKTREQEKYYHIRYNSIIITQCIHPVWPPTNWSTTKTQIEWFQTVKVKMCIYHKYHIFILWKHWTYWTVYVPTYPTQM